jgi:hypothetical protein
MYYSKSTNGFYVTHIHGDNIPADSVEITDDKHRELLEGQSAGLMIAADESGYPILIDRPSASAEELTTIARAQRLQSFAQEADPLFFKAQRGEATIKEWQDKIEEIRARYPYPS